MDRSLHRLAEERRTLFTAELDAVSKHRLLDRLYESFERDLELARAAIEHRDLQAKAEAIDHAIRIVGELSAALNHTRAPELCANLAALYDFVSSQLTQASAKLETAPLDQAKRVMTELGTAFRQAHVP